MVHGKSSTYNNWKCRCDPCKKAWASYMKSRVSKWRKENPDKLKEQVRRRREDPKVRQRQRERHVLAYGITLKDAEELRAHQKNNCAICKISLDLSCNVDHDHKTGRVRGLLCSKCNWGLGNFSDDPKHLRAAIKYLESPPISGTRINI